MCYGYVPVVGPDGKLAKVHPRDFKKLEREGRVVRDDTIYPGMFGPIYILVDQMLEEREMRFDMVPRFYKRDLSKEAMLKEKVSRRKGGDGFSSYNARSETMLEKASWRSPWREGKRMFVPITAFFERPNEDDAPKEFRGREYKIHLPTGKNLAGLYDHWENNQGESLDSFGIITVNSKGNGLLESIYHPRCPLILDDGQIEEWMDPKTPLARALEMVKLFPAEAMTLEEVTVPKEPKPPKPLKLKPPKPPDIQQSLF